MLTEELRKVVGLAARIVVGTDLLHAPLNSPETIPVGDHMSCVSSLPKRPDAAIPAHMRGKRERERERERESGGVLAEARRRKGRLADTSVERRSSDLSVCGGASGRGWWWWLSYVLCCLSHRSLLQ